MNRKIVKQILQQRNFNNTKLKFQPKGTVKFFNTSKGYGFVTSDKGEDFFFHFSNFANQQVTEAQQGQKVSFEIKDGRKGKVADKIIILDDEVQDL